MVTTLAESHITSLDMGRVAEYENYFQTIAPRTLTDVFRRWLFAYASVHSSWESNVRLYNALKDLSWMDNIYLLRQRIIASRAGLHNNRADNIMRFSNFFWKHSDWFNHTPGETWIAYRNRIMEQAPGIGRAKAAFLLELVYLHKSELACFDTHMIQLYGLDQGKIKDKQFDWMEQHWSKSCLDKGVSPVTARWIFWDIKQKKPNSRYWSHVLEVV